MTIATMPTGTPWISDLAPVRAQVGWGELGIDESVDGNPLTIAGVTGGQPAVPVDVDTTGLTELTLVTGVGPDNNIYDHSEWVAARLTCGSTE